MKTRQLLGVLLLALLWVLGPSHAFAYLPSGLVWPPEDLPVTYTINERGSDDLSLEQLEALFAASFATWTEVPCTTIAVSYQGRTATEAAIDEEHVMSFVESGWTLGPNVLGANSAAVISLLPKRVSSDITFNGETKTWRIGGGGANLNVIDPQSVFTHEIGHFFGLSHTNDDGSATMAAAYLPDTGQRSLSHDDKWGICDLYPNAASTGECDTTDDQCPPDSACGQLGNNFFCIEARDGYGDFCNSSHINCQDTCVYTLPNLTAGFCTKLCVADVDCGDGAECKPFGTVQVCALKDVAPPEADDFSTDTNEADATSGFDFGVVDTGSSADTTASADADLETTDQVDSALTPGETSEGCGCRIASSSPRRSWSWWLVAPLAIFFGWRRQRP